MDKKDLLDCLIRDYYQLLQDIRQDFDLIIPYGFDLQVADGNQHLRLRLLIPLYNDLLTKPARSDIDFKIAQWLFAQESKWRRSGAYKLGQLQGHEDIVYFSAWVLVLFNRPEVVWPFFDLRHFDAQTLSDFDREYLLFYGLSRIQAYIHISRAGSESRRAIDKLAHSFTQKQLLGYVNREQAYLVSQAESEEAFEQHLQRWRSVQFKRFSLYQSPITDDIELLYRVNEKQRFYERLPHWLENNTLPANKLALKLMAYGDYIADSELQIRGALLNLEHNTPYPEMLPVNYAILAKYYVDAERYDDTMRVLGNMLEHSEADTDLTQIKSVIQYANSHPIDHSNDYPASIYSINPPIHTDASMQDTTSSHGEDY